MAISADDRAALDIAYHWDSCYRLDYDGEVYTASRLGSPEKVLTAETTEELRQMIRKDYQAWCAGLREHMST